VDGDPAAAYRYTRRGLTRIALAMLEDIDKNTVDFVPNFDDRLQEPTVLRRGSRTCWSTAPRASRSGWRPTFRPTTCVKWWRRPRTW